MIMIIIPMCRLVVWFLTRSRSRSTLALRRCSHKSIQSWRVARIWWRVFGLHEFRQH
jgi:hypothetical protein